MKSNTMIRLMAVTLAALALTVPAVMAEEATKIGFVDMQRALNESAEGKRALNELKSLIFLFSFMPTIDYIAFLHGDKTSTLRLPFTTIFFPILIFIVLVMIHLVIDNIENIKILLKKDK